MNTTSGYGYGTNGFSAHQEGIDAIAQIANLASKEVLAESNRSRNATPLHNTSTHSSILSSRSDTSHDSLDNSDNDDDAHADAQFLSASILATIQSTPRHHATPNRYSGSNGTPKTSTPYMNGRSNHTDSSYDQNSSLEVSRDEREGDRRNGRTTNHNMYPPSPTANITPRRRSTRVVKTAKPNYTKENNERDKSREKEKEKDRGREKESQNNKRDNKSISGAGVKRAKKKLATTNEADMPQPVAVLGRTLDLTTLQPQQTITTETETIPNNNTTTTTTTTTEVNWAETVPLYSLARSWMSSGVDLDPFHILRLDAAESALLDMHDQISTPALPPPSTNTFPALPERPRYPSSNPETFEAALQKGCESSPKALLRSYVSNCKTFRTWWKANYTQRINRYKTRLTVLFPPNEHGGQSTPAKSHHSHQSHHTPNHQNNHNNNNHNNHNNNHNTQNNNNNHNGNNTASQKNQPQQQQSQQSQQNKTQTPQQHQSQSPPLPEQPQQAQAVAT